MSHDVGITLKLATAREYTRSLEALEAGGWEIRDTTGSSFIREDATDFSDWLLLQTLATDEIRGIVATRDQSRLFAGVVLMYSGTSQGCSFLWIDRNTLVVSPSINRAELAGGWIDASWYLQRLCQPLVAGGCDIESLNLDETTT
jgi:hypothetical protein